MLLWHWICPPLSFTRSIPNVFDHLLPLRIPWWKTMEKTTWAEKRIVIRGMRKTRWPSLFKLNWIACATCSLLRTNICSFDCIVLVVLFLWCLLRATRVYHSSKVKLFGAFVICCEYTLPLYQWIYGNNEYYRIIFASNFVVFLVRFEFSVRLLQKCAVGPWFLFLKKIPNPWK